MSLTQLESGRPSKVPCRDSAPSSTYSILPERHPQKPQECSSRLVGPLLESLPVELRDDVLRRLPWVTRGVCRAFRTSADTRLAVCLSWPVDALMHISQVDPGTLHLQLPAVLGRLPCLQSLAFPRCPRIALTAIALPTLTSLDLDYSGALTTLAPLSACRALTCLTLRRCTHLADLRGLRAVNSGSSSALRHLTLSACTSVADLSPLSGCTSLLSLDLTCCTAVTDLTPLSGCVALRSLDLTWCSSVAALQPLAACKALERVSLDWCHRVRNVMPLLECRALKELSVHGCGHPTSEVLAMGVEALAAAGACVRR